MAGGGQDTRRRFSIWQAGKTAGFPAEGSSANSGMESALMRLV